MRLYVLLKQSGEIKAIFSYKQVVLIRFGKSDAAQPAVLARRLVDADGPVGPH
jgi:hypothetical protein